MSESVVKLRKRIKELEAENFNLREDRNKYRNYVVGVFKDNLKLVNGNQYYGPDTFVKNISSLFAKCESFVMWW